jgi:CDP-glucose 4,6-dehydratase
VLEPLIGYLLLNGSLSDNPGKFSKAFNFGPFVNDHLTVQELVNLALKLWGSGTFEMAGAVDKAHEANLLQLDIDQAMRELDWRPRLTASEAIRWTIEWYRKEVSAQADFTFEQIDNYLS